MNLDKIKKYLKEFKTIFILVVVALTVKTSLIEIYVVPTGSMEDEILVGDLMIGAASNAGFTSLAKPSANNSFLTMGTSGSASWTTTIDGGTF